MMSSQQEARFVWMALFHNAVEQAIGRELEVDFLEHDTEEFVNDMLTKYKVVYNICEVEGCWKVKYLKDIADDNKFCEVHIDQ